MAIGTSHGAYKFTRALDGDILANGQLKLIHEKLPNTPLVMHGASSVPKRLQDMFKKYGGMLAQIWGVPMEEIVKSIRFGVRKVNVDTDLRLACTVAIRKVFSQNPAEFDPRKYFIPAIALMTEVCVEQFTVFGSA